MQRALEDLSQAGSKFNDIKEKPDSDQFGEFVTLLFAKDDKGGIDESKRLTALVHLVNKAAKGDQALLASLSTHVASKLKGNSVKSTEETALSIRFKKALQVTLDGPMPAAHRVLLEAQAEFDKAKSYKDSITTTVDVNFAQTALDQAVRARKPESEIAPLRAKVALLSSKTVVSTSDQTLAETAFEAAKAKLDKVKTTTVSSASEKLNLSDWINKLVIIPQQRNIVLKSAFQNMQRQLDNLRGHFSAIAMRHFGDQVSYASSLRPAVEDVIKAADSLDKDSVDSIKAMREALKNNEAASGIFESELNGLKLDPLRVPKTHNEHPGDLIDRIVNYLQSFVYNPSLSLWKSSGASAQSARSSESSRPTVAKAEEAKPASEQSKALAS